MNNINILILSAGRRVELVNEFKKAAKKLGIESKIIAADISNTAPATYFADKTYIIPRIGAEGYIESIIDICNQEDVRLVVPTIDTELLSMAQNRKQIEARTKAKVLVSDLSAIEICRDKIRTQDFFDNNGFGAPKRIDVETDVEELKFPMFIKPLDGSSSQNTFKVNNYEELKFFKNYIKKPILQEFISGEEYTIDCFLDFNGNVITVVPRIRLATRNGEVLKGKIVKDREIIEDVKRLLKKLKPIGQITVQCMKTAHGIRYIEINPRFGGGAPMSIKAGANSCENLYKLLLGETLEYNENYKENLTFLRFDDSIALDENKELIND